MSCRLTTRIASSALRHSRRTYATQKPIQDHPYLSQLDPQSPSGSTLAGDGGGPHLGPFPLPGTGTRDESVRQAEKRWRQLRAKEKLARVFTQATSLIVVLAGGAVVVAVFYSFGTEVLVSSSPTRVFEDCVDRVKASEELHTILLDPLTFHGANSTNRLHRNRRISSTHSTDPRTGAELLFVKFWVEGASPPSDATENWFDVAKKWIGPIIWEDSTKPGSYVPRPTVPVVEIPAPEPVRLGWGEWVGEGLASAFAGIVPRRKEEGGKRDLGNMFTKARKPALGEYSTGEVFAELVKDSETGNFVYRSLYVDIPDARDPLRHRVHIPTANVGESEPSWHKYRFWKTAPSAVTTA